MKSVSVAVISDVHFAGPAESKRAGHESNVIGNCLLRVLVDFYRRHIWLRDVFAHNHLLDYFIETVREIDFVVGNGDYSCDTGFVGPMDEACYESAELCLAQLRSAYGGKFLSVMGDHELGKKSIFGGAGGMRLASWDRAVSGLKIKPFWTHDIGVYRLIGITSSLVGLPVFDADVLEGELEEWRRLREEHLRHIEGAFSSLSTEQRVILFCHDPSALPFLAQLTSVKERLNLIEHTVIGHLHSDAIIKMSRFLSGMPHISFMGSTVNRLSAALRQARIWKLFRVSLCPSLAGIELLKDGAFLHFELDPSGERPAVVKRHAVPREGLEVSNSK